VAAAIGRALLPGPVGVLGAVGVLGLVGMLGSVGAGVILGACSDGPLFPSTGDSGQQPVTDGGGASDATTTGDGGAPQDGAKEADPPVPPRCADLVITGGVRMITLVPTDLGKFDGVTSVLRGAAWTSATGKVFVVNRSDPFSDYRAPVEVGSTLVTAGTRVALASDGNGVAVVSGASLVMYTRTSSAAPFTVTAPNPFGAVNAWVAQAGGVPSEPVLGSSGKSLFFLRVPPSGAPVLVESTLSGASWGTPAVHQEAALASVDPTHRRRPTGVSFDDRTLFFWDENTNIERIATRATAVTGDFTDLKDLGPYAEAAPNQACTLIYYQSTDNAGPGVFNTSDGL
jgi:hypothetical protein